MLADLPAEVEPGPRRREVDALATVLDDGRAQHLHGQGVDEVLHHGHDVVVIGECLVALQHGEFRVVHQVDALVPEDLAHLEDPFQAADDEALEVQLVGDSQVQLPVEGPVVGLEGVGDGPCGDWHQRGGLHLDEAPAFHEAAHAADYAASEDRDLPGLLVRYEVQVALPVPALEVGEAVELLRQGADCLAEDAEVRHLDGDFAGPGPEDRPRRAEPVPDVEVLKQLVQLGEFVAAEEELDTA